MLDSLSLESAGYLGDLGRWFEYLARFQHALEHHVPLYVPGNTVSQETLREFEMKGERTGDAELRGDYDEAAADRLTRERSALVSFFPIVEHAFGKAAAGVRPRRRHAPCGWTGPLSRRCAYKMSAAMLTAIRSADSLTESRARCA